MRILDQGGGAFFNFERYSGVAVSDEEQGHCVVLFVEDAAENVNKTLLGKYESFERATELVNQIASWSHDTFIMPEK